MPQELPLLDQITIASPCAAPWEEMQGNEQVRFCGECRKNVYNFSEMTRAEAEALILEKEGKLCGRYYRRADGTTLTRDCPVGIRGVRARLVRAACGIAATFVALIGGIAFGRASAGASNASILEDGPLSRFAGWVSPQPQPQALGGVVCMPVDWSSSHEPDMNSENPPTEP